MTQLGVTFLGVTFLGVARVGRDLIAREEVRQRWTEPSALAEYTVAGLAGHLARGLLTVDAYLSTEVPPDVPLVDAPHYYLHALGNEDPINAPMHHAVRARSAEVSAGGHRALVAQCDELLDRLADRLATVPGDQRITAFGGLGITIDEYLKTRLVELVAHCDDLAVSVGVDPPAIGDAAGREAVALLAELARLRWGTYAVMRALARRERADPSISAM